MGTVLAFAPRPAYFETADDRLWRALMSGELMQDFEDRPLAPVVYLHAR